MLMQRKREKRWKDNVGTFLNIRWGTTTGKNLIERG